MTVLTKLTVVTVLKVRKEVIVGTVVTVVIVGRIFTLKAT